MPGNSQQTTTASSEPWDAAQPTLKRGLQYANNLFDGGIGGTPYTGPTVVPWSSQTMQGARGIQNNATRNSGGRGLSGQYQGVINNGGMNTAMRDAYGGYNRLQSDPFNAQQKTAMGNTQRLANSQFSITPELQRVLDAQSGQASDAVNQSVSGMGRYGSATHNKTVADTIGDLTNRTVYNDYTNFQGRRDAANQNLFSMGQQGINTQMGANNAIAGLGQQAFNNLGAAYTGMNAPNQDLMTVGGLYEDLATRQMNDRLRIFNESQNKPWELLGRLNAVASGAGSMGGTQTQSAPGQNPFLTAAGYGLSGLGLLGGF